MSRILSQCVYCGIPLTALDITMDHVIPVSRGGSNERRNKAPACAPCNSEKGSLTAAEYIEARLSKADLKAMKRKVDRRVTAAILAGTMTVSQKRDAVARGRGCVAPDGIVCHCSRCDRTPAAEKKRQAELRATATARFQAELEAQQRAAEARRAESKAAGRKAGT